MSARVPNTPPNRFYCIFDQLAALNGRAENGFWLSAIFRRRHFPRQLGEQLSYQAHHDPLTGLPNRMLLDDRLRQAVAQGLHGRQRVQNHPALAVLRDRDDFQRLLAEVPP